MDYSAGTAKGETAEGQFINGPKKLGIAESKYTAEAVTETFVTGQTALAWTPCVKHVFQIPVGGTVVTAIDADVKITRGTTVYYGTFAADSDKTGTLTSMTFVDATGAAAAPTLTENDKIAYKYDNVVIPQDKLPTLVGNMQHMTLYAKARRIAIYYSQIAAFEAKNDYGFDLADSLATQAVGKLSYDIDTEIVELIKDTAAANTTSAEIAELTWSKTTPVNYLAA